MNQTKHEIINVIFDLGGVLIDWNPRYLFQKLFGDDREGMEIFLKQVCHDTWNQQQDAGRSFAEGIQELVLLHPTQKDFIQLYYDRWPEQLGGPIHASVDILQRLAGRHINLYAITNWSHETFPHAKSRFHFLKYFKDIVVSGEEKLLKPDPKIYQLLLQRNAIHAHESAFIDDNLANVKGAEAVGIHGIHFKTSAKLEKTLIELGLL